jgi:hypothetical protein
MGTKYYRDGTEARRIRAFTREKVLEVLTEILEEAEYSVGEEDDGVPLFRSGKAATERYREGKAFLLLAQNPTKAERCRVIGHDDELSHSGKRFMWSFIIQVSPGKSSSNITDEAKKLADDELMSVLQAGLEERYAHFRDELKFMQMSVEPADSFRENGGLNPLELKFYNYIRLASDVPAITQAS